VIHTYVALGSREFEARYRVDAFRQFIAKAGNGSGLVQIWGQKARRVIGDDGPSPWTLEGPADKLHTVDLTDIVRVSDQRPKADHQVR
jgi:hypothetical protein